MIPQLILIIAICLGSVTQIKNHGKTRVSEYNFTYWLVTNALMFAILLWGGFFDPLIKAIK